MKAPSIQCLLALRAITAIESSPPIAYLQHRCYATNPSSQKTPPPPPTASRPVPPKPTFRPSPAGLDLRKRRDDDDDFKPYPLTRPIGMPNPPQPGQNMGKDKRTLRQRRDDFHNYEKHLERRAKMTQQLSKPYFRDWSNMRFHKGKVFVAPERLFRSDIAMWFPNFFGKTLRKGLERKNTDDGYRGLGRDTCNVMRGKISVVSIVSNTWAENQVATFCSREANPELGNIMSEAADVVQRVEINNETNVLKWWLLQLFASSLRKTRNLEEQSLYFMVRRGVGEIIKEAIGLLNDKGGYVYLVDKECKIRWAGSAEATDEERESMVRGLKRLIQEARSISAEKEVTLEVASEEAVNKREAHAASA